MGGLKGSGFCACACFFMMTHCDVSDNQINKLEGFKSADTAHTCGISKCAAVFIFEDFNYIILRHVSTLVDCIQEADYDSWVAIQDCAWWRKGLFGEQIVHVGIIPGRSEHEV